MTELIHYFSAAYLVGMATWMCLGVAGLFGVLKLRQRWKGSRWRAAPNLLLSCWMLLALLTIGEVVFALCYDQTDAFNMTNVSKRWFDIHIKQKQRALPIGNGEHVLYRDNVDFPVKVADDQHHILFIGDSFTQGHGVVDVDARFSNRIRRQLEQDQRGRFLISNLADSGSDLRWSSMVISRVIQADYKVNTVVYVICLNDIESFHPEFHTYYSNISRNNPRFFLFRDTYLLNFLFFRVKQFTMPEVRSYYSFVSDYYQSDPWTQMSALLKQLDDVCEQKGIELRVAVFPFLHDRDDEYDFAPAHDIIVKFCQDSSIPVLDLAPKLLPHREDGLTVNPFDAHPNSRAHELAAAAIRENLLTDLIRPKTGTGETMSAR